MTPDTETDVEGEYTPEPMGLSDGDLVIFDRAEFEQDFNCYAALSMDGQLWVLDKESRKWVSAEKPDATKPAQKFRSVQ